LSRHLRLSMSDLAKIGHKNPVLMAFWGQQSTKPRPASQITRAVSTAEPTIRNLRGGVEISFAGARLATLNDLLAMSVQERRKYRSAWHKLVRDTAIAELGGRPPLFQAAIITLTRYGPRAVDPDAIIPKAPIDGLRYAGFLPDDTAQVICGLSLKQRLGPYSVVIQIKLERTAS